MAAVACGYLVICLYKLFVGCIFGSVICLYKLFVGCIFGSVSVQTAGRTLSLVLLP